MSVPVSGKSFQDEASHITEVIMAQIGECDLETALGILCNIAGQLVAGLSEGKPSGIRGHTESLAENIRQAAIAKLLYEDSKRREPITWQ